MISDDKWHTGTNDPELNLCRRRSVLILHKGNSAFETAD